MTVPSATPRAKNATGRAGATAWQFAAAALVANWLHENWMGDLFGWTELQIEAAAGTVIASLLAWVKNWVRENPGKVPDVIEEGIGRL